MYTAEQIRTMIADGSLFDFYNDKYWRRLSHRIINAHHGECQLCKAEHRLTKATLVHHVLHLKDRPDLAYSRTYTDDTGEHMQLMPLCHDCHERIHERGIYTRQSGYTNEEKW